MRWFVTGGSGFLGGRLIEVLRARGDDVRALVRSGTAGEKVRLRGAEPVRGELSDRAAMAAGMAGYHVVVHAAATVDDWGPFEPAYQANVVGTENVCEAARQAGVRRVVHVSTEALLVGGGPIVDADETRPLPEKPIGLYPTTKGMAEKAARAQSRDGLDVVVVRPRLIWGKGDTTLLPRMVEGARSGQLRWVSGGTYRTSTCHVDNVCEGILCAAERGRPGEVYFLTDGPPVEFKAFLTSLLATQGVQAPTGNIPRWVAHALAWAAETFWTVFRRPGAPPITRTALYLGGEEVTVRDDKARREIGYVGRKTREDGLAEMR